MTSQAFKLAKQLAAMGNAPKNYTDQAASDAAAAVDAKTDFAIIYPNGGSEGSPANISINQRFLSANPFPGFRVQCEAQVFYSGQWGNTGFMYAGGGYGVKALQLNDDQIVVQSGGTNLMAASPDAGTPFGNSAGVSGPLPFRVLVWKVKGAVS